MVLLARLCDFTGIFMVLLAKMTEFFLHGTKKANKTGSARCVPSEVTLAAEALSSISREQVTDMGLGTFLKLELKTLLMREGLLFLMQSSDVTTDGESFIMNVLEGKSLDVTPEVVDNILDVPGRSLGEGSLGKPKDHIAEYEKLCTELQQQGFEVRHVNKEGKPYSRIHIRDVIQYMHRIKNDPTQTDKQVYLFCCVLVTKMLLPTNSNYLIPKTAWMCNQNELMHNLN